MQKSDFGENFLHKNFSQVNTFPNEEIAIWKVLNKRNPIHHWIGIGQGIHMPQIFYPKYFIVLVKLENCKTGRTVFRNLKEK